MAGDQNIESIGEVEPGTWRSMVGLLGGVELSAVDSSVHQTSIVSGSEG